MTGTIPITKSTSNVILAQFLPAEIFKFIQTNIAIVRANINKTNAMDTCWGVLLRPNSNLIGPIAKVSHNKFTARVMLFGRSM